jgi:hypothetical protein
VREQYLLDWSMNDCLRQEKDEWLVRALQRGLVSAKAVARLRVTCDSRAR